MIIQKSELRDVRRAHESDRIALRFGCYDLLHAEHKDGIRYAGRLAGVTVVGVMPDSYVRREKGPDRPIHSEQERLAAVDMIEGVDYSFLLPQTKLAIISSVERLRPDVYVEGDEHSGSTAKRVIMGLLGVEYHIDQRVPTISTSQMIQQLGLNAAIIQAGPDFIPNITQAQIPA